ncbi:hypothetical protein LINPERHAP1_LOCUS10023 [Linum perenne]
MSRFINTLLRSLLSASFVV